jgi:hypothetical protein
MHTKMTSRGNRVPLADSIADNPADNPIHSDELGKGRSGERGRGDVVECKIATLFNNARELYAGHSSTA